MNRLLGLVAFLFLLAGHGALSALSLDHLHVFEHCHQAGEKLRRFFGIAGAGQILDRL